MLTEEQVSSYQMNGYLHVPGVITPDEVRNLSDELEWIFDTWANHDAAWQGPWRERYLTDSERDSAKLIAMNDMHLYSDQWNRITSDPRIVGILSSLLGPNVELHHTTLHAKPPETGSPFPLHQDDAFFGHERDTYIDAILHIDDTPEESGCLRFIPGSHKGGPLEHIRNGAPHLPTDTYRLGDCVPVPAKAGDLVLFCLWTIHGSDLNRTDHGRRVVRMGYRDPSNTQLTGHALGRLGWMVQGRRGRGPAAEMQTR